MPEELLIDRGAIMVSSTDVLITRISTCVSVCLYHPSYRIGGMTHISASREVDTTPSGKFIKPNGFFYAAEAIAGLIGLLRERHPSIREKGLKMVVAGGLENEGPILETLSELENYRFPLAGRDVNGGLHREVAFDTAVGMVTVRRNAPFSTVETVKVFRF